MSPEQLEANRLRGLGRKQSAETCAKRSAAMKGRRFSEEHRRKMSESAKRREANKPTYVKPISVNDIPKTDPLIKMKLLLHGVSKTVRCNAKDSAKAILFVPNPRTHNRVPWNKGKKGLQKAWNKGLKNPISAARVGAMNPRWKGGVSTEAELIRKSVEYKNWRAEVFKRDNYTCVECGAMRTKENKIVLHADHIKPFATHPELRFEVSNGRVLCWSCHKKTHSYSRKSDYQQVA